MCGGSDSAEDGSSESCYGIGNKKFRGEEGDLKVRDESTVDKLQLATDTTAELPPQIAIIVPFRDLHVEQKRRQHLERFVPEMTSFLSRCDKTFRIYIVEQSADNRKFNRGKLLNIGFVRAKNDGASIFIFHDVDLLPSPELLPFYSTIPAPLRPVHIARVWDRYSGNPKYLGGIVAFSSEQYESINGFPNNFWGWGGEDDEMFSRVKKLQFEPTFPTQGSITDLEEMSLSSKIAFLKQNKIWKCMNKQEVLEEHESSWRTNGLANLSFKLIDKSWLNKFTIKIVVDVSENGHWTDLVSGAADTQCDVPVSEIKNRFAKEKHKRKV